MAHATLQQDHASAHRVHTRGAQTQASITVQVGDLIVVDGGMVSLSVVSKAGPDVKAQVVDPGLILSRANLTFQRGGRIVRARNAMLPVLSSKVGVKVPLCVHATQFCRSCRPRCW